MSASPRLGPRGVEGRSTGYLAALYGEVSHDEWGELSRPRPSWNRSPFARDSAALDLRSPSLGGGLAHRPTEHAPSLVGEEALAVVERIVSYGFASVGLDRPVFATVGTGSLLRRRAAHGASYPVSLSLFEESVVLVEGVDGPSHHTPLPPVGALEARATPDVSTVASSTYAAEWLLTSHGVFRPTGSSGDFFYSPTKARVGRPVSDEVLDDLLRRAEVLDDVVARSYASADGSFSRLSSGRELSALHAERSGALLAHAADGVPVEWALRHAGPGLPEW